MGRVATLVKKPGHRVYGVAYEFHVDEIERLFEYLSFREKCGYSLNEIVFRPVENDNDATNLIWCLCYYANEENVYFSNQSDLNALAEKIFESVGPSGTNKEYLYNLCNALRSIGNDFGESVKQRILKYDEHLFALEAKVKLLEQLSKSEEKIL